MIKVIGVRFRSAGKIYYFSPGELEIKTGDRVIVETARGIEYGKVVLGNREEPGILLADCDLAAMEEHRRMWPFFRDRRIDAYGPILKRFGD